MKENILKKALELFNSQGVSNITLRDIAKDLSISDGHLRYYFRTKEDLLCALFDEVDSQISGMIPENVELLSNPDFIALGIASLSDVMIQYKFFFTESIEIYSKYPKVSEKYGKMQILRKSQMLAIYRTFTKNGIFRKDLSEQELQILFEMGFIISDNYHRFVFQETAPEIPIFEALKKRYVKIILSLYIPYCNLESRKKFEQIIHQ